MHPDACSITREPPHREYIRELVRRGDGLERELARSRHNMRQWKAEVDRLRGELTDLVLSELVDINEVAERFGIPARTVQTWRYRSSVGEMDPPTPDEVKTVAQGVPLFWWWDWKTWADESGRSIPLHPEEAA